MGRGGAKKKKDPVDEGPEFPKIDGDIFKLCAMKNLPLVKKLVEREEDPVDVNSMDEYNCTPLTWAARAADTELIDYLVEKGADVDHAAYGGLRAIHHCANNMSEPGVGKLLELGAEVDGTDEAGNTALHFVAARGVLSMIVMMQEHGANVDAANNCGSTPFHKACNNGQLTAVQKLAELGANIDAQDKEGQTGLHLAGGGGFKLIVEWLMGRDQKPDITLKTKAGKTAADMAEADPAISSLIQ